jgi:anti-sigma regulatory factor (Ser/Thr protein kinase)
MTRGVPDQPSELDGYSLVLAAPFDRGRVSAVRREVGAAALRCGLPAERADVFLVAVNEIMTNAVRHGGGSGELRLWQDGDLVCEVHDRGDGFAASTYLQRTEAPNPSSTGGMGLWLARQTSDRLAIESTSAGTTVRVSAARPRS